MLESFQDSPAWELAKSAYFLDFSAKKLILIDLPRFLR